ncbi:hypothetical protein A8B78_13690 [Jannaschia sp. EhC01]|nr:hypothetical protein A8B78_13690 [Jannaschia sp. EhC01]
MRMPQSSMAPTGLAAKPGQPTVLCLQITGPKEVPGIHGQLHDGHVEVLEQREIIKSGLSSRLKPEHGSALMTVESA